MKRFGKLVFIIALAILPLLANPSDSFSSFDKEFEMIMRDFMNMQERMNKIFNEFSKKYSFNQSSLFNDLDYQPKTDIVEKKDCYELTMDLPGYKDANINIEAKDGILSIDVKSQKLQEDKSERYIKKERFLGQIHRSLTLPKNADYEKLTSSFKNGVLTIKIPKKS